MATTTTKQQLQQSEWSKAADFKFSAGPWNLHAGADPFGPTVRPEREFAAKLKLYKDLGFDYVQFHDDDAVPDHFSAAIARRRPGRSRSSWTTTA
jgi:xylose isomerase